MKLYSPRRCGVLPSALLLACLCAPAYAQTTEPGSAPPSLPPTTPTESHATVTNGVPNSGQSPGVVQEQTIGGTSRPTPPHGGVLNPDVPAGGANRLRYRGDYAGILTLTDEQFLVGNVDLRYGGYHVTCDRATFNNTKHYLTFEGNVVLTTARQVVLADYIRLNTQTNEFVARGGRTVIPPDLIGQQIQEPVRISGETLVREGDHLIATNGLLTTCDFPNPHAKIGFAKATVIPNHRIILRKAVIYRYDRAIIRLDYLSLPIHDDIRYSYAPVVGKNDEEGYFVKNTIGYVLGTQLPGLLRLDYMTRKGLGLGFDQAYKFGQNIAGTAILYGLQDKSQNATSFNGRIAHQERFGDTLANLNTDFQNNSYNALTSNSKTQATSLSLNRSVGASTTTATLGLNSSDTGGGTGLSSSDSKSYQYSLSQGQRFGTNGNITFKFNGNDNSQSSSYNGTSSHTGTIQQTGEIHATDTVAKAFDLGFNANRVLESRRTGDSAGAGYYSGTQSLPELTLGTDTTRLGVQALRSLPTRITMAYGNYLNASSVTTESRRALFETQVNPLAVSITPEGWLSFTSDFDFRQTTYKADYTQTVTDTTTGATTTEVLHGLDYAQYVLRGDGTLTQKLNSTSSVNLTYNYLRPYGATPQAFLSDQLGSANALGSNLTLSGAHVKFSMSTGYDIKESERSIDPNAVYVAPRHPWQQVTASLAFRPNDVLQSRFDASYDINTGKLLTATNTSRIRGRNDFALDTGLQYDPIKRRLPQITETLSTPLFSRDLRLTAQTGYNDESHQFYYKSFGLVQSFHDYEYVFSYRDQPYGLRTDRGFDFFIRLKAFPFTPRASTTQFGTAFSTGTVF